LNGGKLIYEIEFKLQALKDLKAIDKGEARRLIEKIKVMENDLAGDVKRLTNFTPEYRLRVGSYRVLFEVEGEKVVIYRVRHRRDAYS
jgi:mRNA interferase RelE/StbE